MTTLGHFTAADGGGYVGRLATLTVERDLRIAPNRGEGERTPTHLVFADDVECGAGWAADSERAVLNVKIDDPAWAEPLRARLVQSGGDDFLLVWRRPSRD